MLLDSREAGRKKIGVESGFGSAGYVIDNAFHIEFSRGWLLYVSMNTINVHHIQI